MTLAVNIAQGGSNNVTFRNRIINGQMQIAQRGTSFTSISTDPVYTLDRWAYAMNGGGAVSASQSSDAPAGFTNSLLTTVTTADGTVASGSYYQVRQCVEGYNVSDFGLGTSNAKLITVSFWMKVSIAGTYAVSLRTSGGGASCVSTISATTSWAQYSVTFPVDTSYTSNTTNGQGLYLTIDLGRGSGGTTGSPNTWVSGDYTRTSSCVQMISTNGATLYLTGVQLEAGTTASPFEYHQYGTELQLCQRYYINANYATTGSTLGMTCNITNAVNYHFSFSYPVPMRTSPTLTWIEWTSSGFPSTTAYFQQTGYLGSNVYKTANSSVSGGFFLGGYTASAEL